MPNTSAAPIAQDETIPLTSALSAAAPKVDVGTWVPALNTAFAKYGLNTDKRMAAAIGQFLVEAGAAFSAIAENLNYKSADRLAAIFPSAFPNAQAAQAFVGNPVALGNHVYANKLGNGDEQSGDGYRFRGHGLVQLTGRASYVQFGATIGKSAEDAAAYCATPEGAAMSGCWFLSSHGCLSLADAWDISGITRIVNGKAMLENAQRTAFANAILAQLSG